MCRAGLFASVPLALLEANIPAGAKAVYIAALDHLRGASTYAWPSLGRLAALTGLRRRAVGKWLSYLERNGMIGRRWIAGRVAAISFAAPEDWPCMKAMPH